MVTQPRLLSEATLLARIPHILSSREAARNCPCEARTGFPEGLYEDILPKDNPGPNEAGSRRINFDLPVEHYTGRQIQGPGRFRKPPRR